MVSLIIDFTIIFGFISLIYLWIRHYFGYWERRNVLHDKLDLLYRFALPEKRAKLVLRDCYNKFRGKAPFAGLYLAFLKPYLLIDLDLIKNVLIKDHHNFVNRGVYYNEKDDPLSAFLGVLKEEKWKSLRLNLSNAFSINKIKISFQLLLDFAENYVQYMEKLKREHFTTVEVSEKSKCIVSMKDLMRCYTLDVFGNCFLGLGLNGANNPNDEFYAVAKMIYEKPRHNLYIVSLMNAFPNLARKLRMKVIRSKANEFVRKIVTEIVEVRTRENIKRKDYMDMLIEYKNNDGKSLTIDEIIAHVYSIYVGSFEATSNVICFALYHLAINQDIQDKVRVEINEIFNNNNNQLTYEISKEFKYLKQIMQETMRLHPQLTHVRRQAKKDYMVSDSNMVITKNSIVFIPIDAIHLDKNIYPNPYKFDPDRFLPTEIEKRHKCSWMPFGAGPRGCIAVKLGETEILVALIVLLRNFKFLVCDETKADKFVKLQIEKL